MRFLKMDWRNAKKSCARIKHRSCKKFVRPLHNSLRLPNMALRRVRLPHVPKYIPVAVLCAPVFHLLLLVARYGCAEVSLQFPAIDNQLFFIN